MNGITLLQEARDLRELRAGQHAFNDGSQEVQRLAAEKVHGPHRFEKQRGRCRHAALDDGVGNPFKQSQVIDGEGCLFGTHGKGVPETGSKILCATG